MKEIIIPPTHILQKGPDSYITVGKGLIASPDGREFVSGSNLIFYGQFWKIEPVHRFQAICWSSPGHFAVILSDYDFASLFSLLKIANMSMN